MKYLINKKSFLIALLVSTLFIPQLNNTHYAPSAQFWTEIIVAYCILISYTAMSIVFFKRDADSKLVSIPLITIYLMLLGVYIIVETKINPYNFIGLNIIALLEMVILILFAINIESIKESFGLPTLMTYICFAILLGGILQSTIGLMQFTGLAQYCGDYIFYDYNHPTTNIFGHFGQRNHYSHYLSWAIFATIYLFHQRRINIAIFSVCMIYLCFGITISGSRSVFLYFITAIIISAIMLLSKQKAQMKMFILILMATITMLILQFGWSNVHSSKFSTQSGLQRLENINSGNNERRYTEWQKAWIIFKNHPIIGVGWNQFAKNSMELQQQFPDAPTNAGLFTNCHNIILQLGAETGVIGILLLLLPILQVCYKMFKNQQYRSEYTIILCMIGTTFMHSMTEYPLWYLYFLAPFIMFLSLDQPFMKISPRLNLTMFAPITIVIWYLVIYYSITYNGIVNRFAVPSDQDSINANVAYLKNVINHDVLLSYYGVFTLDEYIGNSTTIPMSNQQQFAYDKLLNQFHPYPETMFKSAMFYYEFGNENLAKNILHETIIAYPNYKKYFMQKLHDQKLDKLLDDNKNQ